MRQTPVPVTVFKSQQPESVNMYSVLYNKCCCCYKWFYLKVKPFISAILPKPTIHIDPAGGVTWGQKISITCSISTQTLQLLQGTFKLNQISGSFSQNQTTMSNSATFRITKVNFGHRGQYRCQYQQDIRAQESETSDSISLSVTGEETNVLHRNAEMIFMCFIYYNIYFPVWSLPVNLWFNINVVLYTN